MDKLRTVELVATLLIAGAVGLHGLADGMEPINYSLDVFFIALDVVLLDAIRSNIIFSVLMFFGAALLYRELYQKESYYLDDGKSVEAVVPVYNDSEVLHKSVESLNKSEYENLNIHVVCEEEDEESIEAAESLDCNVVINEHPGSKAGAINTVFEKKEGSEYFAIFDADEVVNEDFIAKAVGWLEEGYQGFQGRRVPDPVGLVEKFAYCERALFHGANKITGFSGFRNLRSSSTVIRREVWEKVDGYDDMLIEDLDFAHKCYREGIDIKQHRGCTNLMEAPHSWKDFWGQRKRWSIGQVELLHKVLRRDYGKFNGFRDFSSTSRIVMGIVVPMLLLGLLSKFVIILFLGLELFYLLPIVSTSTIALVLSYFDSKKHDIEFIGFYCLLTSVVIPVTAILKIKALPEYAMTWNGDWYEVEKTE